MRENLDVRICKRIVLSHLLQGKQYQMWWWILLIYLIHYTWAPLQNMCDWRKWFIVWFINMAQRTQTWKLFPFFIWRHISINFGFCCFECCGCTCMNCVTFPTLPAALLLLPTLRLRVVLIRSSPFWVKGCFQRNLSEGDVCKHSTCLGVIMFKIQNYIFVTDRLKSVEVKQHQVWWMKKPVLVYTL